LRSAGVEVVARRYAGMVHGFAGLPQITPLATQAIDDAAQQYVGPIIRARQIGGRRME